MNAYYMHLKNKQYAPKICSKKFNVMWNIEPKLKYWFE